MILHCSRQETESQSLREDLGAKLRCFELMKNLEADTKRHTRGQLSPRCQIIPCDFLPYLLTRLEPTMYVDIGLLSLTVPILDHGRKLFPVTLFVILIPIQVFEAFMILIFPCNWLANTIKTLLAEQSCAYDAEKLWSLCMMSMTPCSPSNGLSSSIQRRLSVC